jgi:DNA repair protein RecO (recombination protein O)
VRGVLLAFPSAALTWTTCGLGTLMAVEGRWPETLASIGLMCGFTSTSCCWAAAARRRARGLFDAYGCARAPGGRRRASLAQAAARVSTQLSTGTRPAARDARQRCAYKVGAARWKRLGDSVISGRTLLDMAADDYDDARTREEARRLMRALIADRLGGQALHTRAVLSELQDL